MGNNTRNYVFLGIVLAGFVGLSAFASQLIGALPADAYLRGSWGMTVYVLFAALNAVLIVPVSSVPLIPLAVTLWGPTTTALLSAFGWILGALAAFVIARRWGQTIIARHFPNNRVERYIRSVPDRRLFITIVLLRMILPVDLLSYILGTTSVRFGIYTLATALGVLPFSLVFSFGATMPPPFQIMGAVVIIVSIIIINQRVFSRK